MKKFISLFLATIMILSVMLSAVSCDELLTELLEDPNADAEENYTNNYDEESTKKRPEKTTEEYTEEYTEPYSEKLPDDTMYLPEVSTDGPFYCPHDDLYPADHHCDWCGDLLTDCYDNDHNHSCDICYNTISDCHDNDKNHHCDVCENLLTDCYDYNGDHSCDACYNTISNCYDDDMNHRCDVCYRTMSKCHDYNGDHRCDTCENLLTDCRDDDGNGVCDVCGATNGYPGLMGSATGLMSADEYRENETSLALGNAADWIANNRHDGIRCVDNITFCGWAVYGQPYTYTNDVRIEAFGYSLLKNNSEMTDIIWNGEIIWAQDVDSALGTEEAKRYSITIDLTNLESAVYNVFLYVLFENGEIYTLDDWGDIWIDHIQSAAPEPAYKELTIPEAINMGMGYGTNEYTPDKYLVSGIVTEVQNVKYGNVVISDGKHSILIYGVYNADGSIRYDALDVKPTVGDYITVLGVIGQYKDAPQMKNGWLIEMTEAPKDDSKIFSVPSSYANIGGEIITANHAAFGPIYNAINTLNYDKRLTNEGCPAITGDSMLWLSNPGPNTAIKLTEYSKAIITFTCDASPVTQKRYEAKGKNAFEFLCFDKVLATGEYTLPSNSWEWNTCEIDLTGVDYSDCSSYNGELVFRLTDGGLDGTWYAIHSIELVP